ncbi:hypothetical protein NDU88_012502 [Pleurodeles waltl]|uniref:Uncharacterized protein n=1 Tax=Pleurodeles waltl TaxID=8319 RepID=A0AAV7R3F5_PLEWA|nr:hypothetical protein NDU88_012502 [Pleurodeles waltl]
MDVGLRVLKVDEAGPEDCISLWIGHLPKVTLCANGALRRLALSKAISSPGEPLKYRFHAQVRVYGFCDYLAPPPQHPPHAPEGSVLNKRGSSPAGTDASSTPGSTHWTSGGNWILVKKSVCSPVAQDKQKPSRRK